MKTITIRIPDVLAESIARESLDRRVSKSDIVRERLASAPSGLQSHPLADILAEIDALPVTGPTRDAARDKKRLPDALKQALV